ncbi:MAG: hypothetical protein BKP49_05595 [Treponema sp. CETP13]|nr:MAG: hypothetical protein BKP49_05595 [Treponema sp. CETP13]
MYNLPMPPETEKLGALYDSNTKSVCFALWAPSAFEVQVNLYKHHASNVPDYVLEADYNRSYGVWSVVFDEEDPENFAYDFSVRTIRGKNFCLDPYAKSMVAFRNDGTSGRAVVIDMQSDLSGKKLTSNHFVTLQKYSDAIIYEVSVRDFTSSPDSGTKTHGTFSAFIEKIPYLQSLGITHIQLMPVLSFYFSDELSQKYENAGTVRNNNYNWGYDPHSYFSPTGWFSSNPADPYSRIRELRQLIVACHEAGIGVILDVVYNHMATIEFLDRIVPGYYFRSNENGSLKGNSGCGNDTASEMPMMHRLITDSLVYWTKEYGVDGFRFDLMGLIESSTVLDGLEKCRAINPSTIFVGEGWKMYNGPEDTKGMDQNLMESTTGVAVFSDEYRDILKAGGMNEEKKGFITGQNININTVFQNCLGNPQTYFKSSTPENIVNYIDCHDGLTLHDVIAHNCRLADSNPKEKAEIIARMKLGNFMVLTSNGIAFLHSGQERGRTKTNICGWNEECVGRFVRNSYDSSDNINNFVWEIDADYAELLEYTKRLIAFRKGHEEFRNVYGNSKGTAELVAGLPEDGQVLGYYLKNFNADSYVVLVNASMKMYKFQLENANNFSVVFDAAGTNKNLGVQVHNKKNGTVIVEVKPLSAVILHVQS